MSCHWVSIKPWSLFVLSLALHKKWANECTFRWHACFLWQNQCMAMMLKKNRIGRAYCCLFLQNGARRVCTLRVSITCKHCNKNSNSNMVMLMLYCFSMYMKRAMGIGITALILKRCICIWIHSFAFFSPVLIHSISLHKINIRLMKQTQITNVKKKRNNMQNIHTNDSHSDDAGWKLKAAINMILNMENNNVNQSIGWCWMKLIFRIKLKIEKQKNETHTIRIRIERNTEWIQNWHVSHKNIQCSDSQADIISSWYSFDNEYRFLRCILIIFDNKSALAHEKKTNNFHHNAIKYDFYKKNAFYNSAMKQKNQSKTKIEW